QSSAARNVRRGHLLHNDFHGAHIFVDAGEISGVIDWGRALSGDPRLDVAQTLFFLDDESQESFAAGYGVANVDPVVTKYQVVVAAEKAAWRHSMGLTEYRDVALARLRALIG